MKMKNVNFFQKHVEKLILGAALLIAVVLVLVYAVGNPYSAEINGQDLGPTEIEAHVEQLARQLDQRLSSSESPLPDMQVPPYTQDFRRRIERGVAEGIYRVTVARPGLDPDDIGPPEPPDPYKLPHPPLPTEVVARAGHGVLGVMENASQQQALVQLVGEQVPQDFRYVSVEGTFDIGEWEQRLRAATALPSQFYRSMIGMAGVYLQRQELDPATGQWGHTTIIQPLPTQVGFLPSYTYDYTRDQADQVVTFIKENQQRIARPEFPPLANQALWLPPSSDFGKLTPDEQRLYQELGDKIVTLRNRIERLGERIEREAKAGEQRDQRRQRRQQRQQQAPPMMESGPPDGPFGGPFDGPSRTPRAPVARADRGSEIAQQLAKLQQDLVDARNKRDEILGVPPDMAGNTMYPGYESGFGDPAMDPYAANPYANGPYGPGPYGPSPYGPGAPNIPGYARPRVQPPQADSPQAEQADSGEITVWAHDLTVEPGKTYRYRILVSVLNPLFRQTRVEETQRQENFNKVALGPDLDRGEQATPWSEPVRVDPEYYFFFVQGGQSPRVEVWHIYDGVWRNEEFSVQPGDPIGGQAQVQVNGEPQTIDMSVGAVVVDLMDISHGGGLLGSGDARLLYLAPGSNQIASRSAQEDRDSPDRLRIQNQKTIQEQQRQLQASARQ